MNEIFRLRFGVCVVSCLTALALAQEAQAQPLLTMRCAADSLTPSEAESRINMMRRCALLAHVGNPAAWFDTFNAAANGGTLKDYSEYNPSNNSSGLNSYVGQMWSYDVNAAATWMLYNSGPTYQYTDGPGFFRWERPTANKRPRPLYPIYGNRPDIYDSTNQQLFLHPTDQSNCFFYLNKQGTIPASTQPYYVNGYCST